jgi:hypothetical protein
MINILLEEHQEMLILLVKHDVSFLLIGGYAVIHYGYERTTGDMDIWLKLGNENRDKFINSLRDFGIEDDDLNKLRHTNFNAPIQAIHIGLPPRKIDFLTMVANVNFEEALAAANYFELNQMRIPILHYNHLILSKITSNRLKDKADVEELQRINKYRDK